MVMGRGDILLFGNRVRSSSGSGVEVEQEGKYCYLETKRDRPRVIRILRLLRVGPSGRKSSSVRNTNVYIHREKPRFSRAAESEIQGIEFGSFH